MEPRSIGAFIAALRKANGLTQRQLAEKLNVSDKAVSRWERDEALPDLTLIPVLAEIFGVTSDEILRGQRRTESAPDTKYEARKTEQQKKFILNQALANYRIHSLISGAIALIGIIAAMIANMGFLRAYIGFFAATIFYVGAGLHQAIITIQTINAMDPDGEASNSLGSAKKSIFQTAAGVCTLICVLFAASLPLLVLVGDAYVGLSSQSWILHGGHYALITLVLCWVIQFAIQLRLGYKTLHREKLMLLGKTLLILLLAWVLTWAAGVLASDICYESIGVRTQWDSWQQLRDYLQTPRTPEDTQMTLVQENTYGRNEYRDDQGNTYYTRSDEVAWHWDLETETPVYACHHYNLYVDQVQIQEVDGKFSAYTISAPDAALQHQALNVVEIIFTALLILEPLLLAVTCARKWKKLR